MKSLSRRDFVRKIASITACYGALPVLGEMGDTYPSAAHGLRRGLGMRIGMMGGGSGLPYDREVKYVETDGNAWVDTGIYATYSQNSEVRIKGSFENLATWKVAFGNYQNGQGCFYVQNFEGSLLVKCCGDPNLSAGDRNGAGYIIGSMLAAVYDITAAVGYCIVNGVRHNTTGTPNPVDATNTVALFKTRPSATAISRPTIYAFTIRNNGATIIDLIPVLATFSGRQEACFFNRAYTSDGTHGTQFYRNAGTGAFTWAELT